MSTTTAIVAVAIVIGIVAIISVLGSLYRKVGPNRALIVYGRGGTKVVVGGGTVVLPFFQSVDTFNLEASAFDLRPEYDLFTRQSIPLRIEAVTQLKIEPDKEKILLAANQFLSKRAEERDAMIRQIMEAHLRGIIGQLTVEEIITNPEMVAQRIREDVAPTLDRIGLELVAFTIKEVKDSSGYISNLSRPVVAANKRAADIADAEARRDVQIRMAQTEQEAAQAQAQAEQARVLAQTTSQAAQAEAQRDLQLRQAEYQKSTAAAQAEAAMAGEIATATAQRALIEQRTAAELLQAQRNQQVQEAEAQRVQAEQVALTIRPAEASAAAVKARAQGEADATRVRAQAEADAARLRGEADAAARSVTLRETGKAEAESSQARGLAEAEAIRAKGLAEAEALEARTAALNTQSEPAIIQQAFQIMPQIARELGQAYARIGSVTYIGSGGDGDGGVTDKVARDVMGLMPAVGGMFQSITGVDLKSLFARRLSGEVPENGSTRPSDQQATASEGAAAGAGYRSSNLPTSEETAGQNRPHHDGNDPTAASGDTHES